MTTRKTRCSAAAIVATLAGCGDTKSRTGAAQTLPAGSSGTSRLAIALSLPGDRLLPVMLNHIILLFLVWVLAAPLVYGQLNPHPMMHNRDSVRARRIAVIEVWSDAMKRKWEEYTYDRRGRPVRVVQYGPAGEPALVQQYTHRGRRTTLRQTYTSGSSTQQATYSLRYDGRGRLVKQSTYNGSGEEVSTRYQFGADGLPVSHYSQYQGRTYDSTVYIYQGRLLIRTQTGPDRYEEFTYDPQGRLLTHTETSLKITNAYYEPGFQPRQQLQHAYSYRPNGLPDRSSVSLGGPGHGYDLSSSTFIYRFYP